jgi:hypothetical protein
MKLKIGNRKPEIMTRSLLHKLTHIIQSPRAPAIRKNTYFSTIFPQNIKFPPGHPAPAPPIEKSMKKMIIS